jgi:5'-nucleotidase
VWEESGLDAYREHQRVREGEPLKPGIGLPLARGLLRVNERVKEPLVEVILISRNDADSGLRIFNSIEDLALPITRASFTGGRSGFPYLSAYSCDLFLSAERQDVTSALKAGFAAALVYNAPDEPVADTDEVRIAFDGDAVLFSSDSERVNRELGLEAFQQNELRLRGVPLGSGPFRGLLEALNRIQAQFSDADCPIRTALVTARNAPAHKRAIETLRAWNVRLNESHFLGGIDKGRILGVFRPHIFFDDQETHLASAVGIAPSAHVPTEYEI